MTVLDILVELAPVPLALIAVLFAAVALLQPRRVPARNVSRISELRR